MSAQIQHASATAPEAPSLTVALLDAWERGSTQAPGRRAVTLLVAVAPATPQAEVEALTVGERDARLLRLRRELFGSSIEAVASCSHCEEVVDLAFEVDDILVDGEPGTRGTVTVDSEDGTLLVRVPTAGDLAADGSRKGPLRGATELLQRLVVPAAGAGEAAVELGLSAATIERIDRALSDADPQAGASFALICPACEGSFEAPFDVVAFLWSELTDWVSRLLGDVHTLALSYGWRESDTLALTPARRRFYLEAVGA